METLTLSRLSKEVWVGWISSLAEAYNMAIYSFIAPLLAASLFQDATAEHAVFFSYAMVFMGSGMLYPLGAFYYGLIGDRQGRQRACIYSTLGLAIATGLMGFIPIHVLGHSAWICFLVCICAQYFFSGGEYHGSIVFSLEHANRKQEGFLSSLSCLFAVIGIATANGLATLAVILDDPFWIRLCFLVGAMSGLLSYLLKNYCQETPAFAAIPKENLEAVNWRNFLRLHWQKMGPVIAVGAFFIVSYSYIFIFLPLAASSHQSFDTFQSLIAYGLLLVLSGILSDRIGIQKVMQLGIGLFGSLILPLSYLVESLLVLQLVLTACACLVIGPLHSWTLRQFEPQNRCRGIFLSSAIATSIFGGSTVPICLMIFEHSHSLVACSIYPFFVALGAYYCLQTCSTSYTLQLTAKEKK